MIKTKHSLIGIFLFSSLFFATFLVGNNVGMMFNIIGLIVVIAGTLGASFISYPTVDLTSASRVAYNSYTVLPPSEKEIVSALMDLSLHQRLDGLLALEKASNRSSVYFLKRALSLVADNFSNDEVRDILYTEMHYFQQRRLKHERIFRHIARLAPAFGVTGSVIGLIGMISGLNSTSAIIQSIPIALTSTLYGIVLANFFLTPIAENIHAKTEEELLLQRLIIEGVTLIAQEYNILKLQTKLESFVTPRTRAMRHKSLDEIRTHYTKMKNRKQRQETIRQNQKKTG